MAMFMAIEHTPVGKRESEFSVAEAKGRLPALVHQVETDGVVHITRRGKPAAVLMSETEYTRLLRAGARRPLAAAIRAWREQTGGRARIAQGELDGLRERAPGRDVDLG